MDGAAAALDTRVLILAPTGKDGRLIEGALRVAGVESKTCRDIDEILQGIAQSAGAALIAEEGLGQRNIERLMTVLEAQPAWSDFPILLLARAGAASDLVAHTLRGLAPKASFWRDAQLDTIRLALIKVAARVTELTTRIKVALPSSYPNRDILILLAARAVRPP